MKGGAAPSFFCCLIYGVPRGSKAPIRVDPYFKNTCRPVNLRVDPYFRYGSTRIFAGRPVFQIRVDPYFTGLLAFTGYPSMTRKRCSSTIRRTGRVFQTLHGKTRPRTHDLTATFYAITEPLEPLDFGASQLVTALPLK